ARRGGRRVAGRLGVHALRRLWRWSSPVVHPGRPPRAGRGALRALRGARPPAPPPPRHPAPSRPPGAPARGHRAPARRPAPGPGRVMARAGFTAISSGKIRFGKDGLWYSDDEVIPNRAIRRLFSQALRVLPDGRGRLELGEDKADVVIEDTPWVVTAVEGSP